MKYQIITAYVGGQYAQVAYESNDQNLVMEKLDMLRAENGSPYRHYWLLNN